MPKLSQLQVVSAGFWLASSGAMLCSRWHFFVTFALCITPVSLKADNVKFAQQIQPILADKCFTCHGPDAAERQAGLRLDIAVNAKRRLESGSVAIVPGNPTDSELVRRIRSTDPDEVMPPPGAKEPLTPQEKELLTGWIQQGARYEEHWAYQAPKRTDPPEVADSAWQGNAIDRFVLSAMQSRGLQPSAAADRYTLVRRLHIFMSDNGMFFGERGLSDCWLLYEDSIRVPLIISDPRQPAKRQGLTVDPMVLNIDVSPTIIELAGLNLPSMIQGRSLVPWIEGELPAWRSEFFCEHLLEMEGHQIPKSEGVRTERWKYIRYFQQQPIYEELFDLASDPLERRNLTGDPQHAEQLQLLRRRCDELLAKAGVGS